MTVELKKGYYIDSYYDKQSRSYITAIKDKESNQIGNASYSGNMTDRNADVQYFKEIFYDPKRWEDFQYYSEEDLEDDFPEPILVDDDEDFDWDKYMDDSIIRDEDDEFNFDESLQSSIKETQRKTKREKLPALSTLSPIMPDGAAGITTFNSGVGLAEEWIHRDELEAKLKRMGFKYKFSKYTDEQLYRIYQERLKYLEKKHKEQEKKKQKESEAENKRENSKDSFMKNGIEFESEDAAREYFGESMHTNVVFIEEKDTKRFISKDVKLDDPDTLFTRPGDISNAKMFDKYSWKTELQEYLDELTSGYSISDFRPVEHFEESLDKFEKRNLEHQIEDEISYIFKKYEAGKPYYGLDGGVQIFDDRIQVTFTLDNYQERFLKGHLSEIKKALAVYGDGPVKQTSFKHPQLTHNDREITYVIPLNNSGKMNESMNDKVYLSDMHKAWNIEEDSCVKTLNENLNSNHKFKTITEGLKYFERKAFSEKSETPELELLYESIKNGLDINDIKKLSNFINRATNADEINTYIKGLLSEDLNDESFDIYKLSEDILNYADSKWGVWNTDIYDIDRDNNKISFYVKGDWKHDHWAFDDAVEEYLRDNYPNIDFTTDKYELDDEDEYDSDNYPGVHVVKLLLSSNSLTEARKPKYVDSMFGKRVKDAMDKGELTYHNIKEWDRKENDGRDPIPPFNTRELMNFYSAHPNYFNESLYEAFDGSVENLNVEEIVPQQKDYDRAKGLKFRGRSFRGNGEPFGSEASKMAKLIKDPIKLVRRAKAVVATYGADNGYMSNIGHYHYVAPDADTDVWGPFRRRLKEFGFTAEQINSIENFSPKLSESLNESYYVREWWGQVDENPFEVAARYDLDIKAIKNHLDSTLYEFIGDLEDLNKAKHDGYFYDSKISEIKGDIPILKELVESLNQVGFILDESATNKGLTNIRGQDWHLQVINPKMFYPTSETEGENITEDEAYKLFRDDLREVEGILDEIEEKYPYVFITFNFGPNKNNVITGGIDMRIRNE